jgi:tricorn protease
VNLRHGLFVCLTSLIGLIAAHPILADEVASPSRGTLLLRQPTISKDHLAFLYAGDIWLADRTGQNPRRLTNHGTASSPHISPDGQWIGYSATYDGNLDVYVLPLAGGQPKRLTFHPSREEANGWSPDSKRVLFSSNREVANNRSNQLYEIPIAGGIDRKVMDAVAFEGRWSPDGTHLAYRPYVKAYEGTSGWRFHRGGNVGKVWIINLANQAVEMIPQTIAGSNAQSNDFYPNWMGDEVIFISDRDGKAANLYAYQPKSKELRALSKEMTWDVRSYGIHGDTAVYESGGALTELNLKTGAAKPLVINIAAEFTQARPQWKAATSTITDAHISATGKRVVISTRGDIFTVPVKDGSTRNLTQTTGTRDQGGLWSPDGSKVAYITEENFQHLIAIRDQAGLEPPKLYPLGKVGYYTLLDWSPDGKTLVYQDNHLTLYAFNIEKARSAKIDQSLRRGDVYTSFSADSNLLAYTVEGENFHTRIKAHDFKTEKNIELTDGLSDASSPIFAPNGMLYFTSSINAGPTHTSLDMSTQERAVRRGIFAMVLSKDGKSPLLPKPGDEEAKKPDDKAEKAEKPEKSEKADKADKAPKATRIDLDGLANRIVGLPIAERRYEGLGVAADGSLYYLERRQPGIGTEPPGADDGGDGELFRFDFAERKSKSVRSGMRGFEISTDGKKILLSSPKGRLEVGDTGDKLDAKPIDLGQLRIWVDPRQEWKQIFNEAWWMEREFFYDPKMHGIDWQAIHDRYAPLVNHVQRREDLTAILIEMLAELQVGHNRTGGGDVLTEAPVNTGLLGADFTVENGRWRIKTIYRGDRWNPFLKAPLAAPGADAREGDYLIAINGRTLDPNQSLYVAMENTIGKQVTLNLSSDPSTKTTRQIVVEPIASESALRQWAWIERNRQYVAQKTNGKVAYIYLPNTASDGFQYFNRMYFAQVDKQAVIIDDRRNGGGQAANYIIELLARPYLAGWKDRDGLVYGTPGGGIYGPKVMLIDQDAGSGGDFLPWAFKRQKLGTVIGTRTWGGLIGIAINPSLMDGGGLTVPFFRFFTPDMEWRVENEGVAPDIEVQLDPAAVNRGQDNQLDAAIATVMKQLADYKPVDRREAPPIPTSLGK